MMNTKKLDRRFLSRIVSLLLLCTAHTSDASSCTGCKSFSFGIRDVTITYGPSTEHNCNCQWTIPFNERDDFATVVILYNTSLPMTSGSGGSTDCSARIRLPGTDGYKCNFKNHFCLAFATQSTTCNITKLKKQIPNEEHSCDSISSWNEAGGSPYNILYNAGNFAGYTKHFTIQYYNINCSKPIIPKPIPIVSQNKECADGKISTGIQSNMSGLIEYTNSGADSEINSQKCKWRINQLQNQSTYALVVYMEKYKLPETSNGCSAYLQLPGSNYYICGNHETSTCRVFLPKNTKCNIEEVKQSTQIFHQGCRNPKIFDADLMKYEILLNPQTMIKKELTIHVDYIKCDVTQTTEQYTTELPTTRLAETTNYQGLEAESGTIDWYIPIPVAICAFLLGIAGMYGFMRYNTRQLLMKKHDDKTTSSETIPHSVVNNKPTHKNFEPTDNEQDAYEVPLPTHQIQNKQDDYENVTVVDEYEEYYDDNYIPV